MTRTKILIVDDEPYMHVLMEHHLNRAGYATLKAVNGREALAIAAEEHPALIIMDYMIEEMDGLAAIKEIKSNPATRDVPIIMITANAYQVDRQKAEASVATLFLNKPFSPTQLMNEIRRLADIEAIPNNESSSGRN